MPTTLTDFVEKAAERGDVAFLIKADSAEPVMTYPIIHLSKPSSVARPSICMDLGIKGAFPGERVIGFRIDEKNCLYLKYISAHEKDFGKEDEMPIGTIKPDCLEKAKAWVGKVNDFYK
jgi:hypothetical protein